MIAQHPDIAARLEEMADAMRKQLGDSLTGSIGDGIRPRATIFDISDPRLLIPRTPKSRHPTRSDQEPAKTTEQLSPDEGHSP